MATYKVVANIHPDWIGNFNRNGMKFCFASCVEGGGSPHYNVVAFADTVSSTVTVTWTERYQIAASKDKFADQALFTTSTRPENVNFGMSYLVDKTWEPKMPQPDNNAPSAGFLFLNETIASAVVYKVVNGVAAPVYISDGPLPPGSEELIPKAKCTIWFSSHHQTSAMISKFSGKTIELDMTGKTTANVWFTQGGLWATADPNA